MDNWHEIILNSFKWNIFSIAQTHAHTQTSELISETAIAENQHSSCIPTNSSHLPKQSILKRVFDLQLLTKVNTFFSSWKTKKNEPKLIDFIEIENHFDCRPKIYWTFKWMGEFNQEQAMATLPCNRIVWETSQHRSKPRWCNWLWIFEKYMQFEWRRNIWDWSNCARFVHYADISKYRPTTNQS